MPHISLSAEILWNVKGFPITNALLTTWLVMAVLVGFSLAATRKLTVVPSSKLQSIAEIIVGGLFDFFRAVSGKYVDMAFPLLASLFLFIITANWIGLLPGVGTIGYFHQSHAPDQPVERSEVGSVAHDAFQQTEEAPISDETSSNAHGQPKGAQEMKSYSIEAQVQGAPFEHSADTVVQTEGAHTAEEAGNHAAFTPLFRGATADLNMTLALAIVAVVMIQYYGFKSAGFHYSSRFFDLRSPIFFFVGILEILSDISKVVSFAFRLFGNIFAGEVLLAVIAFLIPIIAPLPFLMLELFVGFVQALVFSMLTAVFMSVALAHAEHAAHTSEHQSAESHK